MTPEAEILCTIQKSCGLTKAAFARSLGITAADLSRYTSDKEGSSRKISIELVKKVREVYNTDLLSNPNSYLETVWITLCEKVTKDGGWNENIEYREQKKIRLPASLIRDNRPELLKAFYLDDSVNNPEYIKQGDLIIFEQITSLTKIVPNGMYVIYHQRFSHWIVCNNKQQKDSEVLLFEDYNQKKETVYRKDIKGRVIAIFRKVY